MHPCLNVDEIIRHIACELVASKAGATTVALARSCKAIEDPVLDVLWGTQERLQLLLGTLPGDIWNEPECTASAPTAYVSSSLNRFSLAVFQEMPNDTRVGSFPELRSKNAASHRTCPFRSPAVGSVIGSAALRHQRTLFCEPAISPVTGYHRGVHPVHPLVPLL